MLLSYATQVYERTMAGKPLNKTHVAAWQNFNVSRAFLDLGFQVDVMSWEDRQTRPPGPYDVVVDVIANLERLAEFGGENAVKILHPAFAHWAIHNANEAARHANLLRRRGIAPPPKRQLPPSASAETAGHIICRGHKYSTDSFSYGPAMIHNVPQIHPWATHEFVERDMADSRKRFVWLGGSGGVHKGLDVTLEAFADLPDCEVYVCGNFSQERHFEAIYRHELYEMPNIHAIGWMDTASPQWREIVCKSATIMMPSASELACGSLIAGMMSGLIPMATDEGDMDLEGVGIRIGDGSVESVKKAICSVRDRNPVELAELSRAAFEAAGSRYGRGKFLDAYRGVICRILDLEPMEPWVPADAEFRVPEIERIR